MFIAGKKLSPSKYRQFTYSQTRHPKSHIGKEQHTKSIQQQLSRFSAHLKKTKMDSIGSDWLYKLINTYIAAWSLGFVYFFVQTHTIMCCDC